MNIDNKIIIKKKKINIINSNKIKKNNVSDLLTHEKTFKINDTKDYKNRPPIIAVMGHVDHGKTTLLNYILKNKKDKFEHGGITQHMHSYKINTKHGYMTFLDTPGHSAFNSIRCRGTKCTDIVLIIIAADDGIMPQTIESIKLAKEEKIPIIIVFNKIDKINDKCEKIKRELSKYDIIPEEWGGDTLIAYTSAKTGKGIDELLEQINLQAEMLNLKTNYNCKAKGVIIDTKIDPGKGSTTSIIITEGQLKIGDIILSDNQYGKVKLIIEYPNTNLKIAYPSYPVNIIGFQKQPIVGNNFISVENEKILKKIIEANVKPIHKTDDNKYNLDKIIEKMLKTNDDKINIILKIDMQGSLEVLKETINNLSNKKINILKIDVGEFNQSDIDLAITTNSQLLGFNIKKHNYSKIDIKHKKLTLKCFNTIYEIIDYINNIIKVNIENKKTEVVLGIAEVKKIFDYDKNKIILGCSITEGTIKTNSNIKIIRKNKVIHDGTLESIKQFKADVNEVKKGSECGIIVKNYNKISINDKIKAYEITD